MSVSFDGATYNASRDRARLAKQKDDVWALIRDGRWWTLQELSAATGAPTQSVSARLRDFRKPKFGGHNIVGRPRKGIDQRGVWEYRLAPATVVLRPGEPQLEFAL